MKKIQLLLLVMLCSLTAMAQPITIEGKVTYIDNGNPIVGVTVVVKGTNTYAMTNENGIYSITIPDQTNKILQFSFVGLLPAEISVTKSGIYDVQMQTEVQEIGEVVVMGYGSSRKIGTVVGSIEKVNSKSIENRPAPSVIDALQGRVPGLQVYNSSGRPGAVQEVMLHGVGSLNASTTPLYILDGIPVEGRTVLSMNPNDLESVSVLKDASATSIYGSRAANGVIVYTSKRGSNSEKAKISVRSQYGISSPANKDFYNQMMNTNELFAFWEESGIQTSSQINAIKNALRDKNILDPEGEFWNTKWADYILKDDAATFQNDISIQGGSKGITYFVAGSQFSEEGIAPAEKFQRYTLRSNLDARVNKWMKLGLNLALSYDRTRENPDWNSGANIRGGLSYLLLPYTSPYDREGNRTDQVQGTTMWNPYYEREKHPEIKKRKGLLGSVYAEFTPIDNLKIRSVAGLDQNVSLTEFTRLPSYKESLGNGMVKRSTQDSYNATITNTMEYKYNLETDHKFIFLLGQEGVSNNYTYSYAQSEGQTDDRLVHLEDGKQSTYRMGSSDSKSVYLSFFGRADYSFLDKYYFDASIRNDASSRFGRNNQNATFWALGGMWKVSEEDFMKSTATWLTNLTFKTSYGTQGNSDLDSDYKHLATVSNVNNYVEQDAWAISYPGNPDLTWEIQKKLTVGLSGKLWQKLTFSFEWYNRKTDDMLMDVPIPTTTGFSSLFKNVGSMKNSGIDISLSYDFFTDRDYTLSVYGNLNYNKSKITSLFDGRKEWTSTGTGLTYVVGQPISYYIPIYAGVNSETGAMQWYKPGDDRNVTTKDPNNVTSTFNTNALMQNTGMDLYPLVTGGLGFFASWKNIGLSADFAFSLGRYLMSNDRYFSENPSNFSQLNTSKNVSDYWKKPGDNTQYPAWSAGTVMQFDSHLVDNASFARMKNITLSYHIGSDLFGKDFLIRDIKAFITGRNLLTFTSNDFKGMDPEPAVNLSVGRISNSKQIVFGIEVTL